MNTNCPKCDRPTHRCNGGRVCVENSVDWRQRALKAEQIASALASLIRTAKHEHPELYSWAEQWMVDVPLSNLGGN